MTTEFTTIEDKILLKCCENLDGPFDWTEIQRQFKTVLYSSIDRSTEITSLRSINCLRERYEELSQDLTDIDMDRALDTVFFPNVRSNSGLNTNEQYKDVSPVSRTVCNDDYMWESLTSSLAYDIDSSIHQGDISRETEIKSISLFPSESDNL